MPKSSRISILSLNILHLGFMDKRIGLYIDCAGRSAKTSETLTEEASEVQNIFNRYNAPLFGFYSGVEVAPLLGKSRGLDWTGVLLVLAENK